MGIQIAEKQLQQNIHHYLERWFYVESEVWSDCHKKRIDIAMIHKSDIAAKYPFGIEIKTNDKKTGSDTGKWLHQAQSYSSYSFENYGKMMILVAPQISGKVLAEGELMDKHPLYDGTLLACQYNVNTFLAQFNIGELQRYTFDDYKTHAKRDFLRIVFNGSLIWDQRTDELRTSNYERLCKR